MIYYFQKNHRKAKVNDFCGVHPLTRKEKNRLNGNNYIFSKEGADDLLDKKIIAETKKVKIIINKNKKEEKI